MTPDLMASRLRIRPFLCLICLLIGCVQSIAKPLSEDEWWHEDWGMRYEVEVPFAWGWWDKTRAAGVQLFLGENVRPNGSDLVVITEGRRVPRKAVHTGGGWWQVTFAVLPGDEHFQIYFNNPDSQGRDLFMNWKPQLQPLTVTTYKSDQRGSYTSSRDIENFIRNERALGSMPVKWISHVRNPFGTDDGYVSFHQGLLNCPQDGEYKFTLAADDTGFFFIDNQPVLQCRKQSTRNVWQYSRLVTLEAGVHHVVALHSERWGNQCIKIGWQPPGTQKVAIIPPGFFTDRLKGTVKQLLARDGTELPFVIAQEQFGTFSLSKVTYQRMRLSFGGTDEDAPVKWRLGDGPPIEDQHPVLFLPLGEQPIAVDFTTGNTPGTFETSIMVNDLQEPVPVVCRITPVTYPRLLYTDETRQIHVRVANFQPIPGLVAQIKAHIGKDGPIEHLGDLSLETANSEIMKFDVDLAKYFSSEPLLITIQAEILGKEAARLAFVIDDLSPDASPGAFAQAVAKDGWLLNNSQQRLIGTFERDDPSRHRKWALIKWAYRKVRATNNQVILIGDRFGIESEAWENLIKSTSGEEAQWRSISGRSLLENMGQLETGLKGLEADTALVATGIGDVGLGWDRQDFYRCLELWIDQLEATRPDIQIALVSPPPVPGYEQEAAYLAEISRKVAEYRHVKFIDLYTHVLKDTKWAKAYEVRGKGVYTSHPSTEAVKSWLTWIANEMAL